MSPNAMSPLLEKFTAVTDFLIAHVQVDAWESVFPSSLNSTLYVVWSMFSVDEEGFSKREFQK